MSGSGAGTAARLAGFLVVLVAALGAGYSLGALVAPEAPRAVVEEHGALEAMTEVGR